MSSKPYQDKNLMYDLYVKRRMTMTDIHKYFQEKYGYTGTAQTIYNWLRPEHHDLLKYRGKGRRKLNRMKPKLSPKALSTQQKVRDQRKQMKDRAKGKR